LIIFLNEDIPNPIIKLNKGPAIDPAIPISPYPFLAKAQFKLRSKKNKVLIKVIKFYLQQNFQKIKMS